MYQAEPRQDEAAAAARQIVWSWGFYALVLELWVMCASPTIPFLGFIFLRQELIE